MRVYCSRCCFNICRLVSLRPVVFVSLLYCFTSRFIGFYSPLLPFQIRTSCPRVFPAFVMACPRLDVLHLRPIIPASLVYSVCVLAVLCVSSSL